MKKENNVMRYVIAVFFMAFTFCAFSDEVLLDNIHLHGFNYSYKKVAVKNKKTGVIDYYNGEIRVEDARGELQYFERTGYIPGCGDKIAPVSVLNLSYTNFPGVLNSDKKRDFILFCGNTSGRHFTVRIYQPYLGFVSAMDFQDGPVDMFLDEDGIYHARVNYIYHSERPDMKVEYPVYYQIAKIGNSVGFSKGLNFSKKYYKEYIANKLDLFKRGKINEYGYSALLTAIHMNDSLEVCKVINAFYSTFDEQENDVWFFSDYHSNGRFSKLNLVCEGV